MTSEEVELAMTWQLLLAAQQPDAVTPCFIQQLAGDKTAPIVSTNECSDEFKVLASQYKHLSVMEEDNSELTSGLLFYKQAIIVASVAVCQKLMQDAHNTGHIGVTKTYNSVQALFWWPALFSDMKKMVDGCPICQMLWHVNVVAARRWAYQAG